MIPALLVAAAVLVLLSREDRLGQVLPRRVVTIARDGPSRLAMLASSAALGLAVWAFVGGPVGLALGAAVVVAGPRLLARASSEESDDAEVLATLPLALDLLGACLSGGAVPAVAVAAVARAFPGPCGTRLARVASSLAVGSRPAEAWQALGSGRDAAGAAARALARAADGGAPVAASVQRVAADARREQAAAAERRAKRAGVLAVLPLGACFLPAFVLLGVVPAVIGLAGPLLSQL
jgi:pilus assembly protein TadC